MWANFGIWEGGGRNGAGILVDKDLRELVVEVRRVNDRPMTIKLVVGGFTFNIISAYAPQIGLDEEVKRRFWEDLDEMVRGIPHTEKLFIGGDFNGHIGATPGGMILCMVALVLEIETKEERLCWTLLENLIWKSDRGLCKVLPSENLSTLHRLLVMDLEITRKRRKRRKRAMYSQQSIKWGALTEAKAQELGVKLCIREAVREVLGVSKGYSSGQKGDWWWNGEVQGKVDTKKATYLKLVESVDEEEKRANREYYKLAKKEA
ncbi:PREDICTED: uncharacterized protein LOC109219627 [Nicotiana attenuata]|uniref:uncharacterized protein LOC109219627 n=1 Tax=Nicotiana attenuata TaxID=49451 RepID=UPI000905A495|nr:PREDICTED: uncharacterized protein LOC109219627 [Nicotiana attenuata]